MRSTERGERTSSTDLRELKLIELINYRIGCVLSLAVQELAVRSLGDSGKVRVRTLAQTRSEAHIRFVLSINYISVMPQYACIFMLNHT